MFYSLYQHQNLAVPAEKKIRQGSLLLSEGSAKPGNSNPEILTYYRPLL